LSLGIISISTVNAQSNGQELRNLIEENRQELESLQEERNQLEKELQAVSNISSELQREVNSINYRINELNVSIKSNQLTMERLELETRSLTRDIDDTENSIQNKKSSIARLLIELQQKDSENLLTILLKNESLSQSVSEIQSILTLGNNLTGNISELMTLKQNLSEKVNQVQENKRQREIEQGALINRQDIILEQQEEKEVLLARTESEEKVYQQRINELSEKQEEIEGIIDEIEHQLRASFDPSILPIERPGVISFPVQDVFITQCYGRTAFASTAYRTGAHIGVDFRAPLGTPLLAVDSGRVVAIDNNDTGTAKWQRYQFGKYIIIEHDNNLSSLYSHLSSFNVTIGEMVERGDVIGYSGNTGYSFAPHLHLGLYSTPPGGWHEVSTRESAGLVSIPPAAGLVPVGVHIDPAPYLPNHSDLNKCL
ncbi:MAG: peptidoglycan DD-metalloendopeptidase family protein, partial [Candidatus Paceibacterota bacterium]